MAIADARTAIDMAATAAAAQAAYDAVDLSIGYRRRGCRAAAF